MEQGIEQIPFIAHESAMYHADSTNKRLLLVNILLSLLIIGSSICTVGMYLKRQNK